MLMLLPRRPLLMYIVNNTLLDVWRFNILRFPTVVFPTSFAFPVYSYKSTDYLFNPLLSPRYLLKMQSQLRVMQLRAVRPAQRRVSGWEKAMHKDDRIFTI